MMKVQNQKKKWIVTDNKNFNQDLVGSGGFSTSTCCRILILKTEKQIKYMNIKPLGNRILVLPVKKENYITETNIELVDNTLATAEVIEFAKMFEGVYKKGDIVLYSKNAGMSQQYNGKTHFSINGEGFTYGDVHFIIGNVNDK